MLRRSPALIIAIATAALLAGCGGGDDGASDTTTTTTTTIVITTTTTDPEAEPAPPFCGTFVLFGEVLQMPRNTIEQARVRAAQLTAAAAALNQVVPEELSEELEVLASAARELEVTTAAAETVEEAQAAESDLQADPEVAAANEVIQAWAADNCTTG